LNFTHYAGEFEGIRENSFSREQTSVLPAVSLT